MMTQIEMDTMRAIVSFSREYRRQNSFVKLMTNDYRYSTTGDALGVQQKEVLLRISDISYIKEMCKNEIGVFLNNDKSFFIPRKEYEEKLENLLI